MSLNLSEMQSDLRAAGLHGWLFYDFRGRDPSRNTSRIASRNAHTALVLFCSRQRDAEKLVHK